MANSIDLIIRAAKLTPGLYLVPTPLGNLSDITIRALEVLQGCDILYCEDSRVSVKLLRHYGIAKALKRYDDHSQEAQRARIINSLGTQAVALISDAGTPLINDPGFKLARDAIAAGATVNALPGPSAPILALTLSGLATDRFTFSGYMPNKSTARKAVAKEMAGINHTQIVFESVHRIAASLHDLAEAMPKRDAAICREMTKSYQEVSRGTLQDLAAHWSDRPAKGEFVIVIGASREDSSMDVSAALQEALSRGLSTKEAATEVAQQTGQPKRDIYQAALALKDGG